MQGYHRFGLKTKDDQNKNDIYRHIFYLNVSISVKSFSIMFFTRNNILNQFLIR